jgi:hypothetical protein
VPDDGFALPGEINAFEQPVVGAKRGERESLNSILADLLGAPDEPPKDSSAPDAAAVLEAVLETPPDVTDVLEAALRAASGGSADASATAAVRRSRSSSHTHRRTAADKIGADGEDGGSGWADDGDADVFAVPLTSPRRVKIVDTRVGRAKKYGTLPEPPDYASEDTSEDVAGALETPDPSSPSEALGEDDTAPPPHQLSEVSEQDEDDSPYFDREDASEDAGKGAFPARVIIEPPPKRHIWPLFITAMVIFIMFTGGLTYFNRTLQAQQVEDRAAYEQEANDLLHESIALIQEADLVVVPLDRATGSKVTEEGIPQLEALLDQRESTLGTLDSAIEKAMRAKELFVNEDFKELAQHARDAASYRKDLLGKSCQLTTYDIAAMRGALALGRAWDLIVEADTNMRDAAEAGQRGTASAVRNSRDYNQEAVDRLAQANDLLTEATTAFSEADLSLISNYVVAKKASAELALASDEAYLDGDYTVANTKNDEFYAKDAEVVALAAAIPADPLSLIVSAYDRLTAQLHEDYRLLHSRAADADVYLRDYLGVAIQ